ncbi:MAG: hypothetical protein QG600_379 [Patescibacteria group bacterium]|nr:hypothetical protein [Patescibacteria group bacterium]
MRLPKFFIFLILLFISLVFVKDTHAQTLSIGSHSEQEDIVYVTKGEKIMVLISGLQLNTDYRIELGDGRSDDGLIQYNLSWTSARQCGPASYTDTHPNETNKGQGFISISSCNASSGSLSIVAYINTSSFEETGGALFFPLTLKSGRTGNDIISEVLVRITSKVYIALDQTSVTAGNTLRFKVGNLPPSSGYDLTLRNSNGTTIWQTLKFTTDNNVSCKITQGSGSFTFERCTSAPNPLLADANFSLITEGFNCAPASQTTAAQCSLYLTRTNSPDVTASQKFTVDTQQFSFTMQPSSPASEDAISQEGSPRANFNFFEDSPVTISAVGCGADVKFEWWRGADANCSQDGTCNPFTYAETDDTPKTITPTNGTATFTNEFGANGDSELYAMRATCGGDAGKSLTYSFRAFGIGEEYIIVPEQIEADTAWSMKVGGLDDRNNVRGDVDYESCYFIQLINQESDSYIPPQAESDCTSSTTQSYLDNKYREGDEKYFIASSDWDPESDVSMPALAAGNYSVRLYRVDNGAEDDTAVAVKDFCIGGGAGCINARAEDIPPPPPPCQQFNEKGECDFVNTALGILKIDAASIIPTLFTLLLSISGVIILIIIVRSAYLLITSQGNPEKVKEAQEKITSAIVGFLFLLFSLIILETIGVDILKIPGFN